MGLILSWLGLGTLALCVETSMEELREGMIGVEFHESIQFIGLPKT